MVASAVARETVFALRREIARIEGTFPETLELPADAAGDDQVLLRRGGRAVGSDLFPIGSPKLDEALGGGLPKAALTEIHGRQTRDAGSVAGFALGLAVKALKLRQGAPVLWIVEGTVLTEAGQPYAPGLLYRFGMPPEALVVADVRRMEDALWVAEEAAALDGFAAVLLEMRGHSKRLDLTATRRLHRRAQAAGRPFFLLRQAGEPEPTAAPVRLVVTPAPARERYILSRPMEGSIGPPAFCVTIGRSRTAIPATAVLEWNRDECAFDERTHNAERAPDVGAVVSLSGHGPHPARPAGTALASAKVA